MNAVAVPINEKMAARWQELQALRGAEWSYIQGNTIVRHIPVTLFAFKKVVETF